MIVGSVLAAPRQYLVLMRNVIFEGTALEDFNLTLLKLTLFLLILDGCLIF